MSRSSLHVLSTTLGSVLLLGVFATTAQANVGSAAPAGLSQPADGSNAASATVAAQESTQATPIVFVGSARRSSNVRVPKVTVPRSAHAGDTLLLTASLSNARFVHRISGWSRSGDRRATRSMRSMVWVRTATARDAGRTVAVTMNAHHKSALVVSVYRGVDAGGPVSLRASNTPSTRRHTTPAVTVPNGARVVSFWSDKGPSTSRWTTPSSVRLRGVSYSTGTGRVSAAVADPDAGRSGLVGGSTAITNAKSRRGVSWSIVLPAAPAPVVTPTPPVVTPTPPVVTPTPPVVTPTPPVVTPTPPVVTPTPPVVTPTPPVVTPTPPVVTPTPPVVTPPPPVEPVRTATVFGMNISPGTSFTDSAKETAAQQVSRIVSTYGSLGVAKVFYQGALPTTFNTNYEGQVPGKVAAVCFKPDQTALANGSLDASIKRYVDSIPAGWKIMLVNWQEPDDEIWVDHRFTAAQHRAATEQLIDVVRANPAYAADRAEVWDVWMGYSLDSGRWQDAAASPRLDGIGWDYYWNKPVTAWSTDPKVALTKMANTTKRIGIKQWGLFETGDNPHPNDYDGSGRAGFWTKVYNSSEDLGYRYVIYFNAIGTTGDHRIRAETAFGGPVAAMLRNRMSRLPR